MSSHNDLIKEIEALFTDVSDIFQNDPLPKTNSLTAEDLEDVLEDESQATKPVAPKIMVVDDAEDIRQIIKGVLYGKGLEVYSAENGRDAIRRIMKQSPDLILLDISMPDIDGFEVCRRIRQREQERIEELLTLPKHQRSSPPDPVKIIYMTCHTSPDIVQRAVASGGNDFIAMPFTPKQLVDRLKKHMEFPEQDGEAA
ncbi:MAG: response regulator [Candidatus Lindowbacteria bacterium]|nr:response regulator [Candidatus Lindowbacteria bacterium]